MKSCIAERQAVLSLLLMGSLLGAGCFVHREASPGYPGTDLSVLYPPTDQENARETGKALPPSGSMLVLDLSAFGIPGYPIHDELKRDARFLKVEYEHYQAGKTKEGELLSPPAILGIARQRNVDLLLIVRGRYNVADTMYFPWGATERVYYTMELVLVDGRTGERIVSTSGKAHSSDYQSSDEIWGATKQKGDPVGKAEAASRTKAMRSLKAQLKVLSGKRPSK